MQGMTQGPEHSAFRRGAEAMREALAQWLMCGCTDAQRLRVVAAAAAGGENCAARWHACSHATCLALLAAEALDMPIPKDGEGAATLPIIPNGRWQPIETAPSDQSVLVYAAPRDGLNGFICVARHHSDAGWCVDELRDGTHWRPLPAPPAQETSP